MSQDIMDSRDLEERIVELEGMLEDGEELDDEDAKELEDLKALRDDVDTREWDSGIVFIPKDDFEDYARDFAEDIGAIGRDTQWPATHIDWEAAAEDLKQGCSEVEYQGGTYYYRE